MALAEEIKELACEAGFDLVGIAPANPLLEERDIVEKRIAEGLFEGLPWFNCERVERACQPESRLAGARSVISLALNYYADDPGPPQGETGPLGKVARYARGRNYHDVARRMMADLAAAVGKKMGRLRHDACVDSAPLLERPLAQRAGLGWFGKSANILTERFGSWVFLAEIVTDLDLSPGQPLNKDCGRCTICLQRCPTGAIIAPGVVDSRRCISSLTIENRGDIPRELRPALGDWLFGCDVCQEVCPWGRRIPGTKIGALVPDSARAHPSLIEVLGLSEEGFRARFAGSALRRAKRWGLARNAAVALGNQRDRATVPALAKSLRGDPAAVVRTHAAWALGRLGGNRAREALERSLAREPDEAVRAEVAASLAEV